MRAGLLGPGLLGQKREEKRWESPACTSKFYTRHHLSSKVAEMAPLILKDSPNGCQIIVGKGTLLFLPPGSPGHTCCTHRHTEWPANI